MRPTRALAPFAVLALLAVLAVVLVNLPVSVTGGLLPAPLLAKLHADASKVLLAPDVNQRMTEMVIDSAPTSREEFAAFMRTETQRWAQVARGAGLTPQ